MVLNSPLDNVLEVFLEVKIFIPDHGQDRIAILGIIRRYLKGVLNVQSMMIAGMVEIIMR
jgi:hypothetical protein